MKKVNRIPFKEGTLQWLIYGNLGAYSLLAQFFDLRGFSPSQIGILMAVMPLVSLLSNPAWFRAGAVKNDKRIFALLALVTSITIWGVYLSSSFIMAVLAMVLSTFFLASVVPLGDAIVMSSMKSKGASFNFVRVWGTLGFTLVSLILGILIGFGLFVIFLAITILMLFAVLMSGRISSEAGNRGTDSVQKAQPGSIFTFVFMLVGLLCGSTVIGFNNSFFPLYTRTLDLGIHAAGTGFAVMAFSEIPFLLLAGTLIRRMGNLRILMLGIFLSGMRISLMSYMSSELSVMLIQLLHGFNYIASYYAVFDYIHTRLPARLLPGAQAVFWMVNSGLGFFIGPVVGGFMIDRIGVMQTYRYLGILAMVGALVVVIPILMSRQTQKVSKPL
ncbi:MAG: Major facilitator superfamily MFS_1 [Thermotogales bacterium 46_20]|nr:MAG: Major facilitator superfamily MFS_1 [Thermotogales bacterium 46_20]